MEKEGTATTPMEKIDRRGECRCSSRFSILPKKPPIMIALELRGGPIRRGVSWRVSIRRGSKKRSGISGTMSRKIG